MAPRIKFYFIKIYVYAHRTFRPYVVAGVAPANPMLLIVGLYIVAFIIMDLTQRRPKLSRSEELVSWGDSVWPVLALLTVIATYVPLPTSLDDFIEVILGRCRPRTRIQP